MKLNPKKIFLRSPLVAAVSKGRRDLVHLMVKVLGYDVNLHEEHSGMNPLAMAVTVGKKVKHVKMKLTYEILVALIS